MSSYQHKFQVSLETIETHYSRASMQQKHGHSLPRTFVVNDPVWLSVPTAGKLGPGMKDG